MDPFSIRSLALGPSTSESSFIKSLTKETLFFNRSASMASFYFLNEAKKSLLKLFKILFSSIDVSAS